MIRPRLTQAQQTPERSGTSPMRQADRTLTRADRALRHTLSALTRDTVGWVLHLRSRLTVPSADLLRMGIGDLEREIALILTDAARALADRAIRDKTPIADHDDLLHDLARTIYRQYQAEQRAIAKAEQAAQMADLKATLRERGLL